MSLMINGFCDDPFRPVQAAFVRNFSEGLEIGASVAVTYRGRTVVDLWAGHRDPARTMVWERDTIVPVASTTKAMTILAFLLLIDRGQISVDERVAFYWPGFAHAGKEAVTVRDALTHQAGVPGFDPPITKDVVLDWDAVTTRLGQEPHWFGGERRICYHMHTYGFLIGELIRRVDGRLPAQFFREEIAQVADIDFHIGLSSPEQIARVAFPIVSDGLMEFMGAATDKIFRSVDLKSLSPVERAFLQNPGGSGLGNARSIARAGTIIANAGFLDGAQFLKPDTIALAGLEQASGRCPYLGWVRFGLGFALDSAIFPAPSSTCLHWGGIGGSQVIMDPQAGLSFAYTPNNWDLLPEEHNEPYIDRRLQRFFHALSDVLSGLRAVP